MSDTRKRPACPACGGFRFEVAGVGRLRCQGCGSVLEWRAGWAWSNFRPRYQMGMQLGPTGGLSASELDAALRAGEENTFIGACRRLRRAWAALFRAIANEVEP